MRADDLSGSDSICSKRVTVHAPSSHIRKGGMTNGCRNIGLIFEKCKNSYIADLN